MAGLHLGEVLASMAGISVSRTPYKLFHDYFWLQPLNRAFTCNVNTGSPRKDFDLQLTIDYQGASSDYISSEADRKTLSSDLIFSTE
ncbi:hypothetical protein N7536_003464 [Penicillium majusculum]|nr:hypothetical protein N7536_003464 [Penicillium majusculum]